MRPELAKLYAAKAARNRRFQFTAQAPAAIAASGDLDQARAWRQAIQPLLEAGRLGCVVLPFDPAWRYTRENRDALIRLRRALAPLPMVADLRHPSWTSREGRGTLIDYHIGFVNREDASTGYLTWKTGYLRVGARDQGTHLYSPAELEAMRNRMERYAAFSESTFIVFENSYHAKSVINALQMRGLVAQVESRLTPPEPRRPRAAHVVPLRAA